MQPVGRELPGERHPPVQKQGRHITPIQSFGVGCVAAAIEVAFNHPFWTNKTRLQTGRGITFNPVALWAGATPRAASLMPITGLQMSINACLQQIFVGRHEESTVFQGMAMGFGSGFISGAVVAGPVEQLLVFQNQHIAEDAERFRRKKGIASGRAIPPESMAEIKARNGFIATMLRCRKEHGFRRLRVGMLGSGSRDGGFVCAYAEFAPRLEKRMRKRCREGSRFPYLARPIVGLIAAVATQPLDTSKIAQQGAVTPNALIQTAWKIAKTEGVRGSYRGGVFRALVVVSATTIYPTVYGFAKRYIEGE